MKLLESVVSTLNVTPEQATKGLGTLFLCIRMSLDMRAFAEVAEAFPEAGDWMAAAPLQSGGTGELLAMATPGAVRRLLKICGFTEEQMRVIYRLVGSAVRDAVSSQTYAALVKKLPLLG